ncbi:two component sigma-54-dependent hydrogenase transcriptional regulator, Fis family [Candidatus Methylomirabilis oxygeniifera]|uniref:Two component sigma-54-dependent hydrogenase transcriptional regulator, Fis family n=1 Tax=Methylomirabilis oxygeniifera TaxID=671143 RepID=D5MF47_METO1|nr:two component sigma-54-dependent hydrogenase transcriptional regulator, Fis family [Candidatus Methylomirabilis oxyfera]
MLIVDDERDILTTLSLTFEEDYDVFQAGSGAEGLTILDRQEIALIIADQRMPEMTGVEFLERSITKRPQAIRMILTGYTDTASLIRAINAGRIYRYITKPWDRNELKITVKRAFESYELTMENQRLLKELQAANERLQTENLYLKQEVEKDPRSDTIIGHGPAMRRLFDLIEKVIDSSATILLTGETGTGKGVIAHHLHHRGPRRGRLFIEQNCGALPETLLESELFGHRRGAFTGAVQDKKGLFEVADGGTLFLDEVSEMSPTMQVKLLQVLQDGRMRRIGETESRQVDVRIVAATNRDLESEVKKGAFRADLYYRLSVFPIRTPPLRERREDVPLLVDYFLEKQCKKLKKPVMGLSQEAMQRLLDYDFPGNVRELQNLIERAVLLSNGSRLDLDEWLPRPGDPSHAAGSPTLTQVEKDHILEQLRSRNGNLALVAKDLGISRTTLWRRMKAYQIPWGARRVDSDE